MYSSPFWKYMYHQPVVDTALFRYGMHPAYLIIHLASGFGYAIIPVRSDDDGSDPFLSLSISFFIYIFVCDKKRNYLLKYKYRFFFTIVFFCASLQLCDYYVLYFLQKNSITFFHSHFLKLISSQWREKMTQIQKMLSELIAFDVKTLNSNDSRCVQLYTWWSQGLMQAQTSVLA